MPNSDKRAKFLDRWAIKTRPARVAAASRTPNPYDPATRIKTIDPQGLKHRVGK